MWFGPHFMPTRRGDYKVHLDDRERALLAALPDQLLGLMKSPESPGATRLFPPAYGTDQASTAEYERYMRSELIDRRTSALETLRSSVQSDRLSAEQLDAWVRVLNDARLVLGTLLDVSEDEDPFSGDPNAPNAHQRLAYVTLSDIVSDAVDALSTALPPPTAAS